MVYYLYGNSSQKKRIETQFLNFNNDILINPILKSEIGRVILNSFFDLRTEIVEYFKIKKNQFDINDFWIDMQQKIQKKRSSQLRNRCFAILTILRNMIDKIPLYISDSNYEKKQIHRIKLAFNIVIEDLLNFQEEISTWNNKATYNCPRSEWEIIYNDNAHIYEFSYINSCSKKICNEREIKLENLTTKFKKTFIKIIHTAQDFCNKNKLFLDKRFYDTIMKLIEIHNGKRKFDFHTWYCFNLGDFLISELLIGSDNYIYTLNLNDFKLILHFLNIDYKRLISFSQ